MIHRNFHTIRKYEIVLSRCIVDTLININLIPIKIEI